MENDHLNDAMLFLKSALDVLRRGNRSPQWEIESAIAEIKRFLENSGDPPNG